MENNNLLIKHLSIVLLFLITTSQSMAQDTIKNWRLSAGINFTSVPTINISGTDTSYKNALSIAPIVSIRNQSGFGVVYSPVFVAGGPRPGIFMHTITIGFEQYDKEIFDLVADYSHFFFTGTSSIPASPISNEVIVAATYKKWWLRPKASAGIGFGTNKNESPSSGVHDIEFAGGVSHAFNFELNNISINVTPSILLNAGTDEYFSFLSLSKYISHSNKFNKYIKNTHASNRGRNYPPVSSTQISTTTQTFSLHNTELNFESAFDIGSFTLRPSASFFVPVAYSNQGIEKYWELQLLYNF